MLMLGLLFFGSALAEEDVVRVGYLEGEAYGPFAQQTDAAAQTLAELGYLTNIPIRG